MEKRARSRLTFSVTGVFPNLLKGENNIDLLLLSKVTGRAGNRLKHHNGSQNMIFLSLTQVEFLLFFSCRPVEGVLRRTH